MSTATLKGRARNTAASVLTLAAMAGGLVAADLSVTAKPVYAASSVGGTITRTEVMERAKNWVDRAIPYGTKYDSAGNVISTRVATDSAGKNYRTDCSGLVSMAWHLADSPTTAAFMGTDSRWTAVSNGVNGLKPGDVMVRLGHMELFAGWKDRADHTKGAWVYSLDGPIDQDWAKGPNANSHGQTGQNSWSEMTSYSKYLKYIKIAEGGFGTASTQCVYKALRTAVERHGPSTAYAPVATFATNSQPYLFRLGTFTSGTGTWRRVVDHKAWDGGGGWVNTADFVQVTQIPCEP